MRIGYKHYRAHLGFFDIRSVGRLNHADPGDFADLIDTVLVSLQDTRIEHGGRRITSDQLAEHFDKTIYYLPTQDYGEAGICTELAGAQCDRLFQAFCNRRSTSLHGAGQDKNRIDAPHLSKYRDRVRTLSSGIEQGSTTPQ